MSNASAAIKIMYFLYCWCLVAKSRPTPCECMDCSTPGFSVLPCLLEFIQTHVLWVSDVIQPPNPLLSPFPPVLNLSQHQGLFHWVSLSHQVAKVLELQLLVSNISYIYSYSYTKHNYYTSNTTADYLLKLNISLYLFVSMLRIILHSCGQTFLNLFVGGSNDMIKDE